MTHEINDFDACGKYFLMSSLYKENFNIRKRWCLIHISELSINDFNLFKFGDSKISISPFLCLILWVCPAHSTSTHVVCIIANTKWFFIFLG